MNFDNIIVPETYSFDKEGRITVDERELIVPPELQVIGVMADNKTERVYFEFPRYFDDVNDLSTFNIYINYLNANGEPDLYHCDDVKIENDNIVFSWLTGAHLYKFKGVARFTVRAVHADGREWGTAISELRVLEGLNTSEAIYEEDYDFINQQFEELGKLSKQVSDGVLRLDEAKAYAESAKKDAGVALESKVKATSEANRATQEANRAESKAKLVEIAIQSVPKLKTEGNPIILDDTVEQKVSDVLPYIEQPTTFAKGSTTQDGVPAFENSIDFKNSEITAIISAKKNLFNEKYKVGFYDTQGAFNSGLTDRKCSDILPTFGAKNLSFSVSSEKQSIACIICLYKKSKLTYRQAYTLEEFTVDTSNADSYSIFVYGRGEDDSNNIDTNYLQIMCVAETEPAKYEKFEGEIINLTQPITLSEFDCIEIRESVVGQSIKSYSEFFDGSEDEKVDSRATSVYPFRMGIVLEKNTILNDKCYSNMLPFEKNGARMNTMFTNGNVALIAQDKFKSAEELKKWLRSNPLKIMYQSAEPTFEPLPEADQQSILNMVIQAPNATIMTDSGITLSINYIADTGRWVLNQIQKATAPQSQMVTQTQLNRTLATLPMETQAAMIENDLQNSLEEI